MNIHSCLSASLFGHIIALFKSKITLVTTDGEICVFFSLTIHQRTRTKWSPLGCRRLLGQQSGRLSSVQRTLNNGSQKGRVSSWYFLFVHLLSFQSYFMQKQNEKLNQRCSLDKQTQLLPIIISYVCHMRSLELHHYTYRYGLRQAQRMLGECMRQLEF